MPWALCTWALRVIIGVGASAASFCAKYRAGPWKIKKQTHMRRCNNFFLRGEGCVPVAYYPTLTSAPLPLPRERGSSSAWGAGPFWPAAPGSPEGTPRGVKRAAGLLLQLPVLPADFQAIQFRLLLIFNLCYFDPGVNFQSFAGLLGFLLLFNLEFFRAFCRCCSCWRGLSDHSLHDSSLKSRYSLHTACTTHKARGLPSACSSWALPWVHRSYWEDSTGWFEPGPKQKLLMCATKMKRAKNEEGGEGSSSGRNEPVISICHPYDGSWYHEMFTGFGPGRPASPAEEAGVAWPSSQSPAFSLCLLSASSVQIEGQAEWDYLAAADSGPPTAGPGVENWTKPGLTLTLLGHAIFLIILAYVFKHREMCPVLIFTPIPLTSWEDFGDQSKAKMLFVKRKRAQHGLWNFVYRHSKGGSWLFQRWGPSTNTCEVQGCKFAVPPKTWVVFFRAVTSMAKPSLKCKVCISLLSEHSQPS